MVAGQFGVNQENQKEEQALAIVAFIETIEVLIQNYGEFVKTLPREYKDEAGTYLGQLKAIYLSLEDEDSDISKTITDLDRPIKPSFLMKSKIQRLGLSKQIIEMRKAAYTIKDIAARVGMSQSAVSSFCQYYEKATPTEKVQLNKSNVYDIQNNMQTLYASLLRQMARFETDGEVSVKFTSECRQLLMLADKQLKEYSNAAKFQTVATIIERVLLQHCSPEGRIEVIKEFQQLGLRGFTDIEASLLT